MAESAGYDPNLPIPDPEIENSLLSDDEQATQYIGQLRERINAIFTSFHLRIKALEDDVAAIRPIYKTDSLPNAVTTLFTVPATMDGRRAIFEITSIILTNRTAASHTYTIHTVANGGAAGPTNLQYNAVPIAAGATHVIGAEGDAPISMESGDFLAAFADAAASVNIAVYGRIRLPL